MGRSWSAQVRAEERRRKAREKRQRAADRKRKNRARRAGAALVSWWDS